MKFCSLVPKTNGHTTPAVDLPPEEEEQVEEFQPPDGGWGWVVCFASFWVNGTIFGMLNTFGILLPQIKKELGGDDPNVNFKICELLPWLKTLAVSMSFRFMRVSIFCKLIICNIFGLNIQQTYLVLFIGKLSHLINLPG